METTGENIMTGTDTTETGVIEINARCSDKAYQSCDSGVYIDEEFIGYTPLQRFLYAGSHNYKIIKAGYLSHPPPSPLTVGIINIKEGSKYTLDVDLVNMNITGGIYIYSSPEGANIFIDDEEQKKTTPIVVSGLTPGEHKYKTTLPGYEDTKGTITAKLGESIDIHDILVQLEDFGTLYIQSTAVLYGITVPYILKGAKIYIDNIDTGKDVALPITGVAKGIHTFRVERHGTVDRYGMFTINGGDTILISVYPILEPKTGILAIHLAPFIGDTKVAHVYIDGKDTGEHTDVRHAIAEGTHTYRIHLEGYQDPEGKFDIVENRITLLTPHICRIGTIKLGTIDISSNPSGAIVAIDDIYLGQYSPTIVKHLPDGDHTYRLSKLGYADATGTFTIINGNDISINPSLVQEDSILDISCNVIAAMVYIDNHTDGWTTPTEITGLSPGAHTYRLVIPSTYGGGFDDATGTFNIEKAKTTRVDAVLHPIDQYSGNLIVNSMPTGARVHIDDVDTKSTTPYNMMEMSSGIHKIKLSSEGYKDWIGTVNIISGSVVSIFENLIPEKI
jgi:hypothetical protein